MTRRSWRLAVLLTCCSLPPAAASCAQTVAGAEAVTAKPLVVHGYDTEGQSSLKPAQGELRRIFEIGFALDPDDAPQVAGLRSGQSAMTVEGGTLDVFFDNGVPHPSKVVRATLLGDAAPDPGSIADLNLAPGRVPRIEGADPVMTFRIARRMNEYVGVWHSADGGSFIAMFDTARPSRQPTVVARSERRILGIAVQPDVDATKTYFTIWTAGRQPGQFVIGSYGWGDRASS